jgi:carbonic anhydrase
MKNTVPFTEALARLVAGNDRFAQDLRSIESLSSHHRRSALVDGQAPFAIILSCSDSRVPSELVFDCGLGDLFVVRVAGNIAAPSLVGSVEFAAQTFGTELVVVMGHTRCGAVSATVEALTKGTSAPSENVRDIVERIAPSVRPVVERGGPAPEVLAAATRANVRAAANHLRHGSSIIERLTAQGKLAVVGAEYSLETGRVDFFDGAELVTRSAERVSLGSPARADARPG